MTGVLDKFDLTGRIAVVTGGAGLLGRRHGETVAELGGIPVLLDLDGSAASATASRIGRRAIGLACDITDEAAIQAAHDQIRANLGPVNILINNAANNPTMAGDQAAAPMASRLENFPLETWQADIDVGLTGAFLCARVFGAAMAEASSGVILNIASDLALIGPDQRLYRKDSTPEAQQPVKPVTYSVVKAGVLGLTRYLATYWADQGVRANALVPGGVFDGQDEDFVQRLSQLIPLGRMADNDEYKSAVAFLISDASSYMTGAHLVVDGGRTAW